MDVALSASDSSSVPRTFDFSDEADRNCVLTGMFSAPTLLLSHRRPPRLESSDAFLGAATGLNCSGEAYAGYRSPVGERSWGEDRTAGVGDRANTFGGEEDNTTIADIAVRATTAGAVAGVCRATASSTRPGKLVNDKCGLK